MKNKLPRRLSLVALVVIVLATGWVLSGEPARDRIIESALINVDDGRVLLQVKLTFPFRYLSHFPQETGRELRIRIVPVRVPSSDVGAVFRNEGLVPPEADIAAVDQVLYEGDNPDGPYVTIRFTQPVRYQVIPGSDYRSINIIIQELL
jgi:hypothetical protein